jgi:glycosyltransferase involved in cell wall biosynthesis
MLFSIVIPTYNEESDIEETLSNLISMEYPHKEIIVVDDSTDNTPCIVQNFSSHGVRLIRPAVRRGRCEARNLGIESAVGDVVVILNADVLLPSNFLKQIARHYDDGFDSVTVLSKVKNMSDLYSRYVGLHYFRKLSRGVFEERKTTLNGIFWSEGFSVRKSLLDQGSLFPSGFPIPIEAGEDVRFVDELRTLGCKGIIDDSIVIQHIAPSSFREFWSVRKGRGAGTPQVRIYIDGWSYHKLFVFLVMKSLVRLMKVLTIIPGIIYVAELAKLSSKKPKIIEGMKLYWCWIVEQTAFSIGEFKSFFRVLTAGRK